MESLTSTKTAVGSSLERAPVPWIAVLDPDGSSSALPFRRNTSAVSGTPEGDAVYILQKGDADPDVVSRGGVTVIFDGILQNRDELVRRFELSGTEAGPSDVVRQIYNSVGEKILQELRGAFMVLLWDARQSFFLAARDAIGFGPLFYAAAGEAFIFSSSAEAIASKIGAQLDRAVIADYLLHRWPREEETFYSGVRRLPLQHALKVRRRERQVYRYYVPPVPGASDQWVTEDEIGQFDGLFEQAISRSLPHGRAGIFLSGGIDSVSVAAFAAGIRKEQGAEPPVALSLFFPGDCSEESVQRGVAQELGMRHLAFTFEEAVGPNGLLQAVMRLSPQMTFPVQNPWLPAYHFLASKAREHGCDVILTGGGGDELLTVDPRHAADLLYRGQLTALYRLAKNYRRSYDTPLYSFTRALLWKETTRPLIAALLRQAAKHSLPHLLERRKGKLLKNLIDSTPAWAAPDPELRRQIDERAELFLDSLPEKPRAGRFYEHLSKRAPHPLLTLDVEELYSDGARAGIPILLPFWDLDLANFTKRIPPDLLNRGGRSKGLARQMLARRFPELGFDRQKKVLSVDFFRETITDEGPKAWKSVGGPEALSELGIVDSIRLERVLHDVVSKEENADAYLFYDVLNLDSWLRPRT